MDFVRGGGDVSPRNRSYMNEGNPVSGIKKAPRWRRLFAIVFIG
jgi:hypothetical protein